MPGFIGSLSVARSGELLAPWPPDSGAEGFRADQDNVRGQGGGANKKAAIKRSHEISLRFPIFGYGFENVLANEVMKPSARALSGGELRRRPPRDKKPVLKADGKYRTAFRIQLTARPDPFLRGVSLVPGKPYFMPGLATG